ncbi:MAG: 6-phosphogluconolactonase [Rhodanobacter sp.]
MSLLLNVTTHSFTERRAQSTALATRIADRLRRALDQRGSASLAVSGGSTPKDFFGRLSVEAMDWSRVHITLVDERWVPDTDERSNARLVQSVLLQNAAAAAQFVPLYTGAATPEAGLADVSARVAALPRPCDAVVLGMGEDGHTASFFPQGDHLAEALDLDATALVWPMRAQAAGEPRITLSLSALLNTHALYVLVTGARKRDMLANARLGLGEARDYPITAVLTQPRVPVAVYWSP